MGIKKSENPISHGLIIAKKTQIIRQWKSQKAIPF